LWVRAPISFYQNQGTGSFLKLSSNLIRPLISEARQHVFPAWVDVDDDGWPDLLVNVLGTDSLFRNTGDGGFVKITGDPLVSQAGSWCGMAWADYDNDRDLDVLLTAWRYPICTGLWVFRNEAAVSFRKMTQERHRLCWPPRSLIPGAALGATTTMTGY
jgi:hypothetical protein